MTHRDQTPYFEGPCRASSPRRLAEQGLDKSRSKSKENWRSSTYFADQTCSRDSRPLLCEKYLASYSARIIRLPWAPFSNRNQQMRHFLLCVHFNKRCVRSRRRTLRFSGGDVGLKKLLRDAENHRYRRNRDPLLI
jgi:hypothetical protein